MRASSPSSESASTVVAAPSRPSLSAPAPVSAVQPPPQPSFDERLARVGGGRVLVRVELNRPKGTTLGFSVVGFNPQAGTRNQFGVFVEDIAEGGLAHRYAPSLVARSVISM